MSDDWKPYFYNRCARILNANCIASNDIDEDFFDKDEWDCVRIMDGRNYCYSKWIKGKCSSGICNNCKDTLDKISNFVIYEVENLEEYQKMMEKYRKMMDLQERFADIAIETVFK